MSCRKRAAPAAATAHARAVTGWHDSAIQNLFHSLSREAKKNSDLAYRAVNESDQTLIELKSSLASDTRLTPGRRDKLEAAYIKAAETNEELSPPLWYAVGQIVPVAVSSREVLNKHLADAAVIHGKRPSDIARQWRALVNSEEAAEYETQLHDPKIPGLPSDSRTIFALKKLGIDNEYANTSSASWTKLSHGPLSAYMYDRESSTLSVVFADREQVAQRYIIPTEDWDKISHSVIPATVIAGVLGRTWQSQLPLKVSRCQNCGEFTGTPAHFCPSNARKEQQNPSELLKYKIDDDISIVTPSVYQLKRSVSVHDNIEIPASVLIGSHESVGQVQLTKEKPGAELQVTPHLSCSCESQPCLQNEAAETLYLQNWDTPTRRISKNLDTAAPQSSKSSSNSEPLGLNVSISYPEIALTARLAQASLRKPITMTPTATESSCKRNFGLEIEVDAPEGTVPEVWAKELAEAFKKKGLARRGSPWDYNESKEKYSTELKGGWKVVLDSSCDAEIVSPILSDTRETWATVNTALEILSEMNAQTSTRTGLHVHVSAHDYANSNEATRNLISTTRHYEDTLMRIATDPGRGKHRGNNYCGPNSEIENFMFSTANSYTQPSRDTIINLDHLRGTPQDRIEWRLWDCTLDAGVIQTRTALSIGLTEAATRGITLTGNQQPHGIGYANQLHQDHPSPLNSYLELLDTVFTQSGPKENALRLYAITSWQEPAELPIKMQAAR